MATCCSLCLFTGLLPQRACSVHLSTCVPEVAQASIECASSPAVQDIFGRFVIRGYGSVLVPTVPGKYVRCIRTFAPVSSTYLQAALGWLTGNLPEFYDSRFVASNEGREVVRVQSTGVVRIQMNVMTRGMASHGYTTGGPPDAPDLDAEGEAMCQMVMF